MSDLQYLTGAVMSAALDPDEAAANTAVDALCDWLQANPSRVGEVDIAVVSALRSGRHFNPLKTLSDVLNGLGHPDPRVRMFLAQGLVNTGAASAAIDILRRIKPENITKEEQIETSGLTGRAFKDLYMRLQDKRDSRGGTLLNLAVRNYKDAFDKSDKTDIWSGENLLTLLRRAKADGVTIDGKDDLHAIADRITAVVEKTPAGKRTYYQWATLAVVHVSTGAWDQAHAALGQAIESKGADAFSLGATLRQLEQVWGLDHPEHAGAGLLAALQTRLLQLSGGNLRVSSTQMQAMRQVPEDSFEKIFGAHGPVTRAWMMRFLDTGASVGQITKKLGGGVGTCFIVNGGDFHDSLAGERLILTNDHVVSPHPEHYASNPPLRVEKAQAKFEVFSQKNGLCEIAAKEIVWSSAAQDHDACLIRLDEPLPETLPALTLVPYVPIVDSNNEESVYIVGHPGGRSLSYSMQNNRLLDHNCKGPAEEIAPRFIHYFTPTEPGSSGSPALNADLDVIGLHHAGGKYMRKLDGSDETYPANEAVWIEAIRRAARSDLDVGQNRYTRSA